MLTLKLTGQEHLVYLDGAEDACDPKADQFIATQDSIRVGGFFDFGMPDTAVHEFAVEISATLSARFGVDHRRQRLIDYSRQRLDVLHSAQSTSRRRA